MLADLRSDVAILQTAALSLGISLGCGLLFPPFFWLALLASVAAGVAFLALRHPTGFSVAWLLVAGMSLEMTLNDLAGDTLYQSTIAAVKSLEIVLACLCALRFGPCLDLVNPVWAYAAMLAAGMAHGLYPGLTLSDSVRSLIGSAAPFAFCFCRLPPSWPQAIITATKWCPIVAVAADLPLALADIRPLFIDSGGARLAGLGHPAFLAGVCLPAIYACLIQLYRHGRRADLCLLIANFAILALTGARAPLAYAVAVTALSLASIRSTAFRPSARLLLALSAGCAVPMAALFAGNLSGLRLFNVVANQADNLSGRDLLWPEFQAAADRSPWFGWGIGAGNVVIPPDSRIARTLHTWAAHNEYLRIQVEGGQIGLALLATLFAAWVILRTRRLPHADKRIMRLAFLAFACHALTDNVLISTPACVLFTFATAVFARLPLPSSARRA